MTFQNTRSPQGCDIDTTRGRSWARSKFTCVTADHLNRQARFFLGRTGDMAVNTLISLEDFQTLPVVGSALERTSERTGFEVMPLNVLVITINLCSATRHTAL